MGELVAEAGQRRVVGDPAGERRRDRDDRPAGAHRGAVRPHHDAVVGALDRPHGRLEQDALAAELLGHQHCDPLRAADEAVLLRAALGVEQQLERAGRVDIEEHV